VAFRAVSALPAFALLSRCFILLRSVSLHLPMSYLHGLLFHRIWHRAWFFDVFTVVKHVASGILFLSSALYRLGAVVHRFPYVVKCSLAMCG
jgi:hypothetical protein